MGRLHKLRILFCSSNRFEMLPPPLGDCQSLSQNLISGLWNEGDSRRGPTAQLALADSH